MRGERAGRAARREGGGQNAPPGAGPPDQRRKQRKLTNRDGPHTQCNGDAPLTDQSIISFKAQTPGL